MVQTFMPLYEVQARHWLLFVVDLWDKCYMVFDSANVMGDEHREGLMRSAVRFNPSLNNSRYSVIVPVCNGLTSPHHAHRNFCFCTRIDASGYVHPTAVMEHWTPNVPPTRQVGMQYLHVFS